MEYDSQCLGSIRGGNVFKFGHEEDFDKIKKLLLKILSATDSLQQFCTKEGELADFSKEIANDSDKIKGIGRAFVGKILSIYFPEVFINIFGHQDLFLEKIYAEYKPETSGVELYLRK